MAEKGERSRTLCRCGRCRGMEEGRGGWVTRVEGLMPRRQRCRPSCRGSARRRRSGAQSPAGVRGSGFQQLAAPAGEVVSGIIPGCSSHLTFPLGPCSLRVFLGPSSSYCRVLSAVASRVLLKPASLQSPSLIPGKESRMDRPLD